MRRSTQKEIYESPVTTKRTVMMESNCMATSGDDMAGNKDRSITISTSEQSEGSSFDLSGGEWTQGN